MEHDYYRAPDRTSAVEAWDDSRLGAADVFTLDVVDGKGIDPAVMLVSFQSLLTGVPWDELPTGELIAGDEGGPWIEELPERLRDTLADAEERRLRELAERWVRMEEFWWEPTADDVLPFLGELVALARRARDRGELLYCRNGL
jgi:hypothetical protein